MIVIIVILIIFFSSSCDAPRNNPLDPRNTHSPYVSLSGEVQTVSIPQAKIAQVNIRWKPGNQLTQTNAEGYFIIDNIMAINGWLIFSRNGYHDDSTYVSWGGKKSITINQHLNARPTLDSLSLYSMVRNNYPALKRYDVVISAKIHDPDNDIDSVYVKHDYLKISGLLAFDINMKAYTRTFNSYDFNISYLDELIGKDFILYVKDNDNHRLALGQSSIKRVIDEEIVFVSPSGYQIVTQTPTFNWEPFYLNFPFSYLLEIFTQDFPQQLARQEAGIPADSSSWTLAEPIPFGEYSWVIWCIDEFQNRARSKPASFRVE